jgi:hypothetical protein
MNGNTLARFQPPIAGIILPDYQLIEEKALWGLKYRAKAINIALLFRNSFLAQLVRAPDC